MKNDPIILLLFIILFFGCKEEFPVVSKSNEHTLVIEGGITNNPGPYSVRLSLTSPIEQPFEVQKIPYLGCKVTISDDKGNSELLAESGPGIYRSAEGGIQGQVGNEYRVTVVTSDGTEYETGFQRMEEGVGIDSLYAELTYHQDLDYPFGLPGYQFYTDTKTAPDQETYILWNMVETYKYFADYQMYGLALFGNLFYMNRDADSISSLLGQNYDTLYTCWNTQTVSNFYTGKTSNLTIPQIDHQPLHFVSTDSKKISERYSLLLQQYSISKEAYYFWKGIEDQISEENFLYTKQPYNVVGNLKNKNNPDELVLGYFTVASVDQKRVFIDRPIAAFYYTKGYIGTKDIGKKPIPYYLVLIEGGIGFVHKDCVDCRTEGGVIQRPDFWVDF